ncbi:Wadjet anti-phage system protein JetA family protein [Azospira sp. I09]|uniref:Wadjet anti-phage system protein JetA family protein n=1 Tax=Azospira sp. I09 TaxID=1765049 RepID=UPI0012A1A392|nr:Wadjet anti-phage system protein JetA family protein [Azospira sp. I09]BBN89451.1 hypothetical protein AZSP09_24740 [Azospira sp. I09]
MSMRAESASSLFDLLPANIFSVLSGKNAKRAWALLHRLATQYFGPDCDPPYPDGYLHGDITKEIERFLLDNGWESDECGPGQATPLNVIANMLLARLIETGWLVEDRIGGRDFISMRPTISRLFDTLDQFANSGPSAIGGSIQMVFAMVKETKANPRRNAEGFEAAAKHCVNLISSLNGTAFRVRDLMADISRETEVHVFVRRFFVEQISEIYIRDFKDLRTENHPLRHRMEIIEMVNAITREDPLRTELLNGYREMHGNHADVEALMERDVERFHRLLNIERFLTRIDRIIDTVYQRANATLAYRLKATDRIEAVISDSIAAVKQADDLGMPIESLLLSPSPIVSEDALYQAPARRTKPAPVATCKRIMTPTERALYRLRKIMIAHRDTSPAAIRRHLAENFPAGKAISAADLPANSVHDVVLQAALSRVAFIVSNSSPEALGEGNLLHGLGAMFETFPGQRVDTEYFNMPNFVIKKIKGGERAA